MSIFVFVLIYIGFAGVKFLLKQMTSNAQAAPVSEELTEVFPVLSEPCDEVKVDLDHDFADTTTADRTEPSMATPQQAVKGPEEVKKPMQDAEKIALTTRNEARRAFIYTEIFNRKYE